MYLVGYCHFHVHIRACDTIRGLCMCSFRVCIRGFYIGLLTEKSEFRA